jgi:Subtilase family
MTKHSKFFPWLLCLFLIGFTLNASGRPVPQNLANGLEQIVSSNLITKADPSKAVFNAKFATKEAADFASRAITDATTGKYLVEVMPDGSVPIATLQTNLAAKFPAFEVRSVDTQYVDHGVLEGFVAIDDVPVMAQSPGVGSVILQLRPIHSVGLVTSQGVNQHRVNKVSTIYNLMALKNWDGAGMSIGVLSDSFNSQPSTEGGQTTAQADAVSGDLPGAGNMSNSQPVVVLEEYNNPPNATNEGRGMCQIVADVAPKARLGFATADAGELGFANNIRALGGLTGYTKDPSVQQGFKGDVVCDDVSYLDEPMFQDGIIAQGVNDVVANGVSYFSSAANNWSVDGYESAFRPVANGTGLTAASNSALANTNINLAGVDPALYKGGFHNFKSNGLDVAQTLNSVKDAQAAIFQWNDPYDVSAPVLNQPPIFTGSGSSTGGQAVDFGPFAFTAGTQYVITEHAVQQTPADNFDAIIAVIDQNGNTIVDQDTGVDETVYFFPPASGNYTIRVHPYSTPDPTGTTSVPTQGPFNIAINTASGVARITQDFNLLFFDMSGNFISAVASNNFANNRPYELFLPNLSASGSQVQLVISRSNVSSPPGSTPANRLKYVFFGNGLTGVGPAEYFDYLMPVTFGHSAAAGGNSVAAYAAFRPNIPEEFTSPGPVTIYFDAKSKRLAKAQVRQKPDIAAADGVNNTFFPLGSAPLVGDTQYDPDDFPNFYGTSAASPHSAALAALVLQSHGGPGSLTPAQVKQILQSTAWAHDLDPFRVAGSATAPNGAVLKVSAYGDSSTNAGTGSNDPDSITVTYTGPGVLTNLTFNPEADSVHAGNTTGGNFNGFTPADFLDSTKYNYTPGMVWTNGFKFGNSVGLGSGDVTVTRTNPAPAPANPSPLNPTQHCWTLNLAFPNNNFISGKVLKFNNTRSVWQDATTPQGVTTAVLRRMNEYSVDNLGGSPMIPEDPNGTSVAPGMSFRGTVRDGANTYTLSGRIANNIGHGWTPLDGYGFINVEAAVSAPVPKGRQ